MKVIAFVLAVFVSFLVVQPCADTDVHAHDEKSMHVDDTHSHNSDAQDGCSAFCVCSCCSVSMQLATIYFYNSRQEVKILTKTSFGYKSFYKSYFSNSIWEPPIV